VPFLFDDPTPDKALDYGTRPLVWASFALNRALSGAGVWSYHVFNVLVHLGCGLLLLVVLRRTLESKAPRLAPGTRAGLIQPRTVPGRARSARGSAGGAARSEPHGAHSARALRRARQAPVCEEGRQPGRTREALALAQKASQLTNSKRADILETLASAHATNGDHARAIEVLQQALELPGPTKNAALRERLLARLQQYERDAGR
jgi:tetratricopeptide (TPR) repeat protein